MVPSRRDNFRDRLVALRKDIVADLHLRVRLRSGRRIRIAASIGILRDRDGSIVDLRWLLADETERRRRERRVRPLNVDLKQRVAERTLELTQAMEMQPRFQGSHNPILVCTTTITGILGSALLRLPICHGDSPRPDDERAVQGRLATKSPAIAREAKARTPRGPMSRRRPSYSGRALPSDEPTEPRRPSCRAKGGSRSRCHGRDAVECEPAGPSRSRATCR